MTALPKPKDGSNQTARELLQDYVDRYNRLEDERSGIAADMKDVLTEAQGRGFSAKAIKAVAKRARETKAERDRREENEAMIELYSATLGMLDGTPLGEAARKRLDPDPDPDLSPSGGGGGAGASPAPSSADDGAMKSDPPATIDAAALAQAREAGADACNRGAKIFENPYLAGDPRRAAWDEGWCGAAGSDGMDIPAGLRRPAKSPKKKRSGEGET